MELTIKVNDIEIDRLELMTEFLGIIHVNPLDVKESFEKFVGWIQMKLHKLLDYEEKANLIDGIIRYMKSEPETNERSDAMQFLFNLKFIKQ